MDLFDGIPQMGVPQVWLSLDGEEGCCSSEGGMKPGNTRYVHHLASKRYSGSRAPAVMTLVRERICGSGNAPQQFRV